MTTATATMSALDQAKAYHDSIRSGEVTPAQLLEIFDWIVSAKSMLEAEISKKTIAELKKMVHSYHAKTKKDWVDAFYNAIRGECLLGTYSETFTYEMMMVRESPEEAFKKKIARERAHVEKTSPEAIAKHAAEVAERRAKHVAYANEVSKALENPQTIADFEHIKTYHKNGLASLTATQKALYDELHWTKGRETQEKAEVDKSKIEAFDLVDVEVTLHATKHTQKGHDLFVVTLSDWIERNDFEELCEIARRLSGYYSSYSAPGAIPGFTFKEEANCGPARRTQAVGRTRNQRPPHRAGRKHDCGSRCRPGASTIDQHSTSRRHGRSCLPAELRPESPRQDADCCQRGDWRHAPSPGWDPPSRSRRNAGADDQTTAMGKARVRRHQ